MAFKKIAAAIFVSLFGWAAIPSFAENTAVLDVSIDVPAATPCDVTLDGQRTVSVPLGTVNFAQPNVEMSKTVNVQIRCSTNREVRLLLKDNREETIDADALPQNDSNLTLENEINENYLFTQNNGISQFGGFYAIRSSNWKAIIEVTDPQNNETVEEATDVDIAEEDTLVTGLNLKKKTSYHFIHQIPTGGEDVSRAIAKVFTGTIEVHSKATKILKEAHGRLSGQVTIEASYL